jgi:hypothetical protein
MSARPLPRNDCGPVALRYRTATAGRLVADAEDAASLVPELEEPVVLESVRLAAALPDSIRGTTDVFPLRARASRPKPVVVVPPRLVLTTTTR